MPYQQGYVPGDHAWDAYGQRPLPTPMYEQSERQYAVQPTFGAAHQAPPAGYQATSPHLYPPQPAHYQAQHQYQQRPVQYQQGYQPPYQAAQSYAQASQQSPYQQQQYYVPQPGQHLAQGYYPTTSFGHPPSTSGYPHMPRSPQQQQQQQQTPRPQFPVAPSQRPAAQSRPEIDAQTTERLPQTYVAAQYPDQVDPSNQTYQQRTVAHVQIPVQRHAMGTAMPRSPKRRRSNDGGMIEVCHTPVLQKPSVPQQRVRQALSASSPITTLPSSNARPAPPPNLDYQGVLLSLADEYITAAHSRSSALARADSSHEQLEEYHGLMAFGMGCLQSVLKNYRQSDPRKEARIRLRFATLLHEETENGEEAETVLSKGIAVCERSRLIDLKYAMQHLLVRVLFKTSFKAAMKAVEKLVAEVEALKLVHWAYAFRFLRVSLSLQTGSHADIATLTKHLSVVSSTADHLRHVAVRIIAAALEAMVHLRSGAADAVELAERALAAARTHQLSPEMQRMPQLQALLDCLDLTCALARFSPDQIGAKMKQLQDNIDVAMKAAGWQKDGSFMLPLGVAAKDDLAADTAGIMTSKDGEAALAFNWLSSSQLYAFGYFLSGLSAMQRDVGDSRSGTYLAEGSKLNAVDPGTLVQSLAANTMRVEWQIRVRVASRMQQVFGHCARSEWTSALHALRELNQNLPESGHSIDKSIKATLAYLDAVCKHGLGDLKAALVLYNSADLTFQPTGKNANAVRDLQAVATLNSILILRSVPRKQEADALHTKIEPYCLTHNNKALVAAYFVLKATDQTNNAIIKRKSHLQAAIQAARAVNNRPMICVILNIMMDMFFRNIVGTQALQSAKASRTTALQTQNNLWIAVANGMYGATLELCGEHKGAAALRDQASRAMQDLPPTLKQRFQEEST